MSKTKIAIASFLLLILSGCATGQIGAAWETETIVLNNGAEVECVAVFSSHTSSVGLQCFE